MSYIDEGQFKCDKFDYTFGRRMYISGNYRLGWLKDGSLHGYGKDNNYEGLFD